MLRGLLFNDKLEIYIGGGYSGVIYKWSGQPPLGWEEIYKLIMAFYELSPQEFKILGGMDLEFRC